MVTLLVLLSEFSGLGWVQSGVWGNLVDRACQHPCFAHGQRMQRKLPCAALCMARSYGLMGVPVVSAWQARGCVSCAALAAGFFACVLAIDRGVVPLDL